MERLSSIVWRFVGEYQSIDLEARLVEFNLGQKLLMAPGRSDFIGK